MTKDEIAIVISIASLCVAAIALGWNIYRDVVLKPRLRVSVMRAVIASEAIRPSNKFIISAVNFGPGKIRISIIRFRQSSIFKKLFRKWQHGVLIHDYRNPLSGQLPSTLDVGEKIDLIFPWDSDCLCGNNPSHIGIADSFGRTHWAPKKEVQNVIKQWKQEFGNEKV